MLYLKGRSYFLKREPFLYTLNYQSKAWILKEVFHIIVIEDMVIGLILQRLHPFHHNILYYKKFQDFQKIES